MRALLCLFALYAVVAHAATNPLAGTWVGTTYGATGCTTASTFFKENYVSYNYGANCPSDTMGGYMGTYIVTRETITVFFAVSPSPMPSLLMEYKITGNTLKLTMPDDVDWEMTLIKQAAYAWDGVWSGFLTADGAPNWAEFRSGQFQSYPYSGSSDYQFYGGRCAVTNTQGTLEYAITSNPSFNMTGLVLSPIVTYDSNTGVVMDNSASTVLPFVTNFTVREPASILEGVWNGGIATGCIQTVQFTSNLYRAFATICTGGGVGGYLGHFDLDTPNVGQITVYYHWTSSPQPTSRVISYNYTEGGIGDGFADVLSLLVDGTTLEYYRVREATGAAKLRVTLQTNGDDSSFSEASFISSVAAFLQISTEYVRVDNTDYDIDGNLVVDFTVIDDLGNEMTSADSSVVAEDLDEASTYTVGAMEVLECSWTGVCPNAGSLTGPTSWMLLALLFLAQNAYARLS